MKFTDLCDCLDAIRAVKGVAEKSKETKSFLSHVREEKHELFPIIRLLVPRLDRDRPSYRIKESKISKLLIKMMGLPKGSMETKILENSVTGANVDFGDVAYSIIKKYIVNKDAGLTILDINKYLDEIANRTSDNGLDDLVLQIFRKLSAKNIKWFIQIVLKDLKLGIGENSILNCLHEDGANFYATNNNLKKLCEVLNNPQVRLHELEINIFEVFKPMLSKRCDATNFKKCFPDEKVFFIENKFDGERFQIHIEEGKFKYFSRNGFDFTNSYGASFNEGIFTPLLKNVFDPETKRVILDGEMMLWNKKTQSFGSKGMNMDVKKLSAGKYQPCFCVYDILLHNDKVLSNLPLYKRLQILKTVVKTPINGVIHVSDYTQAHSRSDIVNALNASVDKNEEGIVVKDPKSVYKCSDRNSGWFKVKLEYFADVIHDLDVLMMGGIYGAGRKISSLIVGISSGPDTYFSLVSVGSGLNYDQLDNLNEKLKSHGVDFKEFATKTQGKLFFGRETPDIYIEPQNSCVLQVRASELTRTASDNVKCPYTLRFPRVLAIREDKPVDECLSMNELLDLTSQNKAVVKLNKRHIELDEIITKSKPAKKIKLEVVNLEEPQEEGDFLNHKKIYVDSGTDKWASEEIYHAVKKSGGEVSYRLEENVDVVLISKMTPKINNLMKQSHSYDIVHVDWLKRVLEHRELIDYQQNEIFYLGDNYRRDISTNFDKYGDSYTENASVESLQQVLKIMKRSGDFFNNNDAVIFNNKTHLFGEYVAYFDCYEDVNNFNSKQIYYSVPDEAEFRYYKGRVSQELTSDVNLIVVKNEERKLLIGNFLENNGFGEVEIVPKTFITETISSQAL